MSKTHGLMPSINALLHPSDCRFEERHCVHHFNQISKDIYGYNVSDYVSVSRHGYHLLNTEKQVEKAVKVFENNANAHPLNLHAHKDLAYAYNKSGQYQHALKAIEQAIALTQPTDSILGYLTRQKQRFETAIQNADEN
jgi:tetratricopeptide (TPR) repeat protein